MSLKPAILIAFALTLLLAMARRNKKKPDEFAPPGYFPTEAEAQHLADLGNADLERLRASDKAARVRGEDLPCGHYKVVSNRSADGHLWWTAKREMTGCPGADTWPAPRGPVPAKRGVDKQ